MPKRCFAAAQHDIPVTCWHLLRIVKRAGNIYQVDDAIVKAARSIVTRDERTVRLDEDIGGATEAPSRWRKASAAMMEA